MQVVLRAAAGRAAYDGFGGTSLEVTRGFVVGTRVATSEGPVAVEDLAVEDLAGATLRVIQPDSLAIDPALRAIRIGAEAIGPGIPEADLLVAPGQRVWIGGVLVAAASLVNGVSVRRESVGDAPLHYVVLWAEETVLAEGVPCEGRPGWQASGLAALPAPAGFVAGALTGNIAVADQQGVAGWAMDTRNPSVPVLLEVRVGGRLLGRVLADQRRPDLEMAGLGDGRCGFALRFARPLAGDRDHLLEIGREGAAMPGSPLLLRRPRASERLWEGGGMGAEGVEQLLQARAMR